MFCFSELFGILLTTLVAFQSMPLVAAAEQPEWSSVYDQAYLNASNRRLDAIIRQQFRSEEAFGLVLYLLDIGRTMSSTLIRAATPPTAEQAFALSAFHEGLVMLWRQYDAFNDDPQVPPDLPMSLELLLDFLSSTAPTDEATISAMYHLLNIVNGSENTSTTIKVDNYFVVSAEVLRRWILTQARHAQRAIEGDLDSPSTALSARIVGITVSWQTTAAQTPPNQEVFVSDGSRGFLESLMAPIDRSLWRFAALYFFRDNDGNIVLNPQFASDLKPQRLLPGFQIYDTSPDGSMARRAAEAFPAIARQILALSPERRRALYLTLMNVAFRPQADPTYCNTLLINGQPFPAVSSLN